MPIYKQDQSLPPQPVIVLVYGDPGSSKTSLGNTCKTPLVLDFDRGFKRSFGRPDVLVLTEGWKEVLQVLSDGTIDAYGTIVIDTIKSLLDDFAMPFVKERDYKLKTNTLKAFGVLGEEAKDIINQIRAKGKDLFIIAHAKVEEDGDTKRRVADITGSTSQLMLRIADQVGYLHMRNDKRVLTFNPTATNIGKNVAGLKDIELPLHTSPEWTGFADREIISKVKEALTTMSEEQREALGFIEEWRNKIDAIAPLEDAAKTDDLLKRASKAVSEITPEHMKKQVQAYLVGHLAKIGWKWGGKETGKFVPVNPPKEAVKEETPVDDAIDLSKDAEAQRAVLNEPPKEDLFAPKSQ